MELHVREVPAQAVERIDGGEGRRDVAGHAEVARMDVQRMRQAQLVDGPRERTHDLPWRHAPMHVLFVDVELALIELEGEMPAGFTTLTPSALVACTM